MKNDSSKYQLSSDKQNVNQAQVVKQKEKKLDKNSIKLKPAVSAKKLQIKIKEKQSSNSKSKSGLSNKKQQKQQKNNDNKKYLTNPNNKTNHDKKQPTKETKHKTQKQIKHIQSEGIKTMIQSFKKMVQGPVDLIQKLQNGNTLQRCQVHNSIFILYCTIDRKPLCVGCMYQTSEHKHHRVLPINKTYDSLRQDSQGYLNKVQSIVKNIQQLIKRTNENIILVQREYPTILYKLEYFYSTFHQMLRQKQKQQVQRLKSLKQRWKQQFQTLALQLHRINYFITDKLNFQYKKMNDQYLLTKRCILETMCKTGKIVKQDMVMYEKGKFDAQLDNLDLVKDLIAYKLTLVTPVFPNNFHNKRKSLFRPEQQVQPQSPPVKVIPQKKKHQSNASVKRQFSVQKKNAKGILRGFVPLSPTGKLMRTVSFN